MPPTPDLSFTGLDEFVNKPVVENRKSNEQVPKVVRKNDDAPIIKELVSNDEEEDVSHPKTEKKTVRPSIAKIEFVKPKQQEKTVKKTVKQVEKHRPVMCVEALIICKLIAITIKNMNAVRPMSYLSKTAHSTVKRRIHKNTAFKNSNIDQRVNTGNPQMDLQDQGVIDSGCSRHMTRNMSYLTNYEEIDGGYVAFGGNPKGGKITGKGTIKTEVYLPNFLKMIKPVLLVKKESSTKPLDETSGILKSFITGIENLVDHKVKVIRCDNGTEFKNREMNQFCEMNGILRQFSVARTPQQNGVTKRKNRTLIKASRTMLLNKDMEENLHIRFSESTPNVVGTKASDNEGKARKETKPFKDYIMLPFVTPQNLICSGM
ncbi:putative ribonuclease H-like domain-containing protein, partial [Tanacetum coccineum]